MNDPDETAGRPIRVARWKNDAKAAVSLYYDDGTDSAFEIAVPALVRRRIPGTFYLCCGWFKGPDDPKLARWAVCRDHPEIVLGNHTWGHGGTQGPADLAQDLHRNAEALRAVSGLPAGAPVSFGVPGGVPWKVTPAEQAACLAAENLVLRHAYGPENTGGPAGSHADVRMNSFDDALAVLDRAEETGGWETLLFHGVGGDWFAFPAADHERLLAEIDRRRADGRLWPGAAVAVRQYEAERDAARLRPLPAPDGAFPAAELSFGTDPARCAEPLTLVAAVPAGRDSVVLEADGAAPRRVPVVGGRAVFDLPPASAPVGLALR